MLPIDSLTHSTIPLAAVGPPSQQSPLPEDGLHSDIANQDTIRKSRILIVDDEPLVARVVGRFLEADGYTNISTISDSRQAFECMLTQQPDIVLLDIMMPHLSGIGILKLRQTDERLKHVPVLILSASSEKTVKREALELGATDFLAKPVDPIDLILRVRNSLIVKQHQDYLRDYAVELEKQVQSRTRQIEASREQIIHCLAKAAEFRDHETGAHVIRVGKYAAVIARQLGFETNWCRQIELAAQLHDVGKIGIPDSILLKPGKLSREEFDIIKEHCRLGCEIMEPLARAAAAALKKDTRGPIGTGMDSPMDSPILGLAANIARTHHEKWDGTGYPDGLQGESIPIEGRITCVADVFDALGSERPYKSRFPREKCLEIMLSERGSRFDPAVLDAFFQRLDAIHEIGNTHQEEAALGLLPNNRS